MRLFGILLIVVILLAGGGYVYLGVQDYKGRQQITAAGLRHLLALQGLPVEGEEFNAEDETPFQINMAGGESTKTISKKLLENYFKDNTAASAAPAAGAAGGEPTGPRVALSTNAPVTNQVAEAKRVFALLKAEFDKTADPAQKNALVAGWLVLQAETLAERTRYLALASAADANGAAKTPEQLGADANELAHRLDRKFNRVAPKAFDGDALLVPAKWREVPEKLDAAQKRLTAAQTRLADARKKVMDAGMDAAALQAARAELGAASEEAAAAAAEVAWLTLPAPAGDEADRRARMAHLLAHLDTDAAWQKRVGIVVGLRRYVVVIATQATRFREMRNNAELPIPSEQASFQKHQDFLLTEARQNVDKARAVSEQKAQRREVSAAKDDAVNQRGTQLKALTAQLQKVQAEVDDLLVQQAGNRKPPENERLLYEVQVEVALTLDEVYRLEALLEDVERERYGMPPKPKP